MLARVTYMVGGQHGFKQVLIDTIGEHVTVTDLHGEILIEHTRPAAAVTYVGNGKKPGPRPDSSPPSPKS